MGETVDFLSECFARTFSASPSHSWWFNPQLNKRSAIPRHTEIRDILANKICKDLGIPLIK
ncbi:MAG: addiction module toxin, HicA family [Microcystis aeruginosa Ma_OC_LR_19540900_S633]|nr:MAG: addiction module toxin, HicA family [Microcystis aeruginosa Ma_OC_LR_19540900_S633]